MAGRLDGNLDTETLEVDNSGEDGKGGKEVHDVGEVLSVERLLKSALFVWPCEEEVEERNNGTFELWSTASVDGGWGESLPHNRLANVGSDEEGDTTSETISLLEEFIKENDNHASNNQLKDEKEDNTSAKVGRQAVKTSEHVDGSLTHGQDDGKQLLSSLVELAIGLQVEVDINQVCTREKLENHSGGDNWGDSQFHQSTSVTCQHHSQPV